MAGESAASPPLATSAVLMTASKHISDRCAEQNRAFMRCKRSDENPEKCLAQGEAVTRCVLSLLQELHDKTPKTFDAYAKCMDYYTNEFDMCRKQQAAFEKACAS